MPRGKAKAIPAEGEARITRARVTTAVRPWGSYTVLEEGPRFKVKRIDVAPGQRLSLQYHHYRSEHWVVISGVAEVTNGGQVQRLHAGESTFVPMGTIHRIGNPGKLPLAIIEVQQGEYIGEDDIVRIEDDYRRGPRPPRAGGRRGG